VPRLRSITVPSRRHGALAEHPDLDRPDERHRYPSELVIHDHIVEILDKIREPLGLDRHTITPEVESIADSRAYCMAQPEYRDAKIAFDLDKLKTNDDVQELVVHESTHLHTWELHSLAEELANALADTLPDYAREGVRKLLLEKVRQAGERVTTDVGHTYLRLLRRARVLDTPPQVE
jgi:hypothetical protein